MNLTLAVESSIQNKHGEVVRIASVVLALHVTVLGFFLFKPPLNYFMVTCLSTVVVWTAVFAEREDTGSPSRRSNPKSGILRPLLRCKLIENTGHEN